MGNMSNAMFLDVVETPLGSGTRREVRLHVGGRPEPIKIHYDIYGGETGSIKALDGFVLGIIFHAMETGLPLYVHGDMTATALYNFDDFQHAWAKWRPKRYKVVDIIPDRIISETRPPTQRAISAYSGGVDSNFTLLRNKLRIDKGGYDIGAVLMVHGFDVGYHDDEGLRHLIDRCAPILEEFGVALKTIKTNSKQLGLQWWPDSHAAELSACLHQFSDCYDTALIGSSDAYDLLWIPWGSNPVTDHLLSSGFMKIVHDAAGFNRPEKVAMLAEFPKLVERVKVCWEGPHPDRNCGVCEKCIRTRLCFVAVGNPNPGCFDDPFNLAMVKQWHAHGLESIADLRTIIKYAKQHGERGRWVRMAQHRLRHQSVRQHLIHMLDSAGMKAPLRRVRNGLRMTPEELIAALRGRHSTSPSLPAPKAEK